MFFLGPQSSFLITFSSCPPAFRPTPFCPSTFHFAPSLHERGAHRSAVSVRSRSERSWWHGWRETRSA